MKKFASIMLTIVSLTSNVYASNSLMSLIQGKRLTLITMTGVHYPNPSGGDPFNGECPNGQAKDAFAFRGLRADGNSATVAYDPKCTDLNFNSLLFLPLSGSRAQIGLAMGEGRPRFNFTVVEQTTVDVVCARSVVKGFVWDDVILTCRDQKNPKAAFIFTVE